jgi:hypothetical protein
MQLTKSSDRKSVSKNIYQGFAEITIALRHHVSRQNLTRLSDFDQLRKLVLKGGRQFNYKSSD